MTELLNGKMCHFLQQCSKFARTQNANDASAEPDREEGIEKRAKNERDGC